MPHLAAAYNLARWLTRHDQDAEDVVQEAFLRAYKFFGNFHGGDSRAWLLTIVRNTCYTWLRQNRAHELTEEFDETLHDVARVDGRPGILPAIAERASDGSFPFAAIAAAFRIIDDVMEPVVVPWRTGDNDHDAESVLNRVAGMDRPLARDLRRLQQYTVPIPPRACATWLACGLLRST